MATAHSHTTWTPSEEQALIAAVADGRMVKDIDLDGRSQHSLMSKMNRLGLHTRFKSTSPGAAIRACLCCQRAFQSEGIGNRICISCKTSNAQYA